MKQPDGSSLCHFLFGRRLRREGGEFNGVGGIVWITRTEVRDQIAIRVHDAERVTGNEIKNLGIVLFLHFAESVICDRVRGDEDARSYQQEAKHS